MTRREKSRKRKKKTLKKQNQISLSHTQHRMVSLLLAFPEKNRKPEKKRRTIITKLMNSVKTKHCMAASFRQIHTLAHAHAQLASQHYLFFTKIFTAGF